MKTAANGEPSPLTSASTGRRVRAAQAVPGQVRERHVPLAHGPRLVPYRMRSGPGLEKPVKIVTYAGFITLDGDEMTFEETTGRVFSKRVSPSPMAASCSESTSSSVRVFLLPTSFPS